MTAESSPQFSENAKAAEQKYLDLYHEMYDYWSKKNEIRVIEEKLEKTLMSELARTSYLERRNNIEVDPQVESKIGSPLFFWQALEIIWQVFREELNEWDRGVGEGKVGLLQNMMLVNGGKLRIPSKDSIIYWADDMVLPTHMHTTLLTAAGYEAGEIILSFPRNRRDEEELRKSIKGMIYTTGLIDVLRIYGFEVLHDAKGLVTDLLRKLRN